MNVDSEGDTSLVKFERALRFLIVDGTLVLPLACGHAGAKRDPTGADL